MPRKKPPDVMQCPLCGKLIATRFPLHACKHPDAHPINKVTKETE